ncbi:aldehyde dehydrogenase [Fonsecaea erecta]|uniref:aldehyde dehydrogenase (NAD(+)) n=1 Tax=Fonsecaea erecta TaxID=1367422 RepID=A0A178ZAY9_9EURO|nr:aldehyde dehydrogenase [Fonsecaea erecta]OAP56947.1 aldehyde dehydrogenase [Fonsecaea erecta]
MSASAPVQTIAINGKDISIPTGLFINNEFVPALGGKTFEVEDPSTGKVLLSIQEGQAEDVDVAVKAARKAFDAGWADSDPAWRGSLLQRLADLMEQHRDEILAVEVVDSGNTLHQVSTVDLPASIGTLRYYATWADKVYGRTSATVPGTFTYTVREPVGVCGQIIPWNFPLMMFIWKIAPALATGNTIVIKSAESTPLSALKMCELIREAGFPAGTVNLISGFGPTVGAAIANHMDIDKVAFTGSTATGRVIMKAAASSNLKKVTLELGGKSPNIVFPDADLEKAVDWSVLGIDFHAGQVCHAGTRIYVHEDVYDAFLEAFTKKLAATHVGSNFSSETDQGPQINKSQYNKILGYIETGKKEGATLHLGGNAISKNGGYFIEPTIFTDVTPNMTIVKEEIFGPVVVIAKFKTEEEVLAAANDTSYGLAAGVHTNDYQRALRVTKKLKAGTTWVNMFNFLHWSMPFGGYKESGIGRELGGEALDNYTNVKTVYFNMGLPAPKPASLSA